MHICEVYHICAESVVVPGSFMVLDVPINKCVKPILVDDPDNTRGLVIIV